MLKYNPTFFYGGCKVQLNQKDIMTKDNTDIVGVALVHYVCPICCKPIENDSAIVMNKVLTKKAVKEVNELNGKAVGYSNNACDNCASYKEEVVYVI